MRCWNQREPTSAKHLLVATGMQLSNQWRSSLFLRSCSLTNCNFPVRYRKKNYANEKPSEVSNLVSLQVVAVENAPLDALAYELGLSRGIAIEWGPREVHSSPRWLESSPHPETLHKPAILEYWSPLLSTSFGRKTFFDVGFVTHPRVC